MLLKRDKKGYILDEDIKKLAFDDRVSNSFTSEYYSPSFIKGFSECPAKQLLNNLDKNDFIEPLAIGSCVHYLLEQKFKNKQLKQDDYDYVKEELHNDERLINKANEYYDAYFRINDDYTAYNSFTEHVIKIKPTPLNTRMPMIKGIVDRIDITKNRIRVLDYKTCSRPINNNTYIDQLTIYKWIVEDYLGSNVDDVCVASLYTKDPKLLYPEITLKSQSQLIDKIWKVDSEVKKSIKTHLYEAKSGSHCKFCKYFNKCFNNSDIEV